MKTLAIAGITLLGITASGAAAQTASNCAPRPLVVERLQDRYGETRQSMGLGSRGMVMELYASPETGTWTITVTRPDGLTCLIGAGEAFEARGVAEPAGSRL